MLAALAPAHAQQVQLRAGLWENSFTLKTSDGRAEAALKEMQAQMAQLPPAQRKMMEDMMARQGVGLGAQGNSVRICMTQAEVERAAPPPTEDNCQQKATRSGNVWQISYQCSGPPPSSGEGRLSLLTPTSYAGEFKVRTVEDGRPQEVQMTQRGKWLGADCGAIRPVGQTGQPAPPAAPR
ncbi:hypothetical protein IP87_21190 [beta proteobacterium AAP121]|nr:hypothetical protein IP80_17710 [beta proteobacterium AAP65]KPF90659.1 hypothetical protein IP87_21190 [beta proteobacterium AAP121]